MLDDWAQTGKFIHLTEARAGLESGVIMNEETEELESAAQPVVETAPEVAPESVPVAEKPVKKKRPPKPPREWHEVQRAFMGCGRCSFFLAGYRILHGMEALGEASRAVDGDIISLTDDGATRQLLYKSYGWRYELPSLAFQAACPECRRSFAAGDESSNVLEVAVRPKGRVGR